MLYIASLAEMLAMLVWFNYSAVLPQLRVEWGLTPAQAGLILAAFQLGYVASTLILGAVSDRVSPGKVFAISAIVAGAAGLAFGTLANDFGSALAFRLLAGIGLGGVYVPGLNFLAERFSPDKRPFAYGIFVGALVVGSGGSLLIASPLAVIAGWRSVVVTTSLGALAASGIMFYLSARWLPSRTATQAPRWSVANVVKVVKEPGVLPMALAYTGHMWELYAFWGWVGVYLSAVARAKGLDPVQALAMGNLVAGLAIVSGGLGTWAGGRMASKYGLRRTLWPILGVSALCSAVFGVLYQWPLPVLGLVALLYGFTAVADSPVYSAAVVNFAPEGLSGLALALTQVMGFGITVIAQATVGMVLQWGGDAMEAWWPAFAILVPGPLLSILMVWWGTAARSRVSTSPVK